jgi:hypothetical protein
MSLAFRRSAAIGVIFVLLAGGVAACGSSSPAHQVSAETYASALCTAVGPFEREIYSHVSAVNDLTAGSPARGKAALTSFLNGIAAASQHARQALRSAGVPNVTQGRLIAGALVTMFTRLDSRLSTAQNGAALLPTAPAKAFREAAKSLMDQVRNSIGDASSGLAGLKSTALEHAARLSPACQTVG